MANISKLIGDTFCLSYHLVYVSMGMTIYPIVNMTISYKVSKFCRKGTIIGLPMKSGDTNSNDGT